MGVLAPHGRSRRPVVAYGRIAPSHQLGAWRGCSGPRSGRCGGAALPALLDLGGADAARAFAIDVVDVPLLRQPNAPDRHHPRSWRLSANPRSPGPLALAAKPGPRPTRAPQGRALRSRGRGAATAFVPRLAARAPRRAIRPGPSAP